MKNSPSPIIELAYLTGNDPAELNDSQQLLMPFLDNIIFGWWLVWGTFLALMIAVFIITPILKNFNQPTKHEH
jgi:hypothetical protein